MNKAIILSALAASLLASFAVRAADTTELKVAGVIKPAACKPNFTGGGVVDYGTIPAKSLKAGVYTVLEAKSVNLVMTCDAAAKVALKFTDNRAASRVSEMSSTVATNSPTAPYNYGLGTVASKNVGGYSLSFDSTTTVDGKSVANIYSTNSGSNWINGAVDLNHEGDYFSFSSSASSTAPVVVNTLSAKINVRTVLNKPENLQITQDVPLDGSATIEVIYM